MRKARRSRTPPGITALAFTIAALVCGMFMFILQDPVRARAFGLLGGKAQLSGAAPTGPAISPCWRRPSRWAAWASSG